MTSNRHHKKSIAAATLGAMALSLAWPMSSNAAEVPGEGEAPPPSPFAGYTAYAQAGLVRFQVYEDSLPIPTTPQLDFNVLYSRADGSTGPSNRSNSSVLWPGDTLGDGLGVLAGNEALDYPIKVKSKFPETTDSPSENAVEISKGSGMRTSADARGSSASTSAFDLSGGGGDGGSIKGVCGLLNLSCPIDPTSGVQLPPVLATAVGAEAVKSKSTVTVGDTVKSVADVKAAGVSILSGLITIDGIQSHSEVSSDGTKATPSGFVRISGVNVAGQKVDFGKKIDVAGQGGEIPTGPNPLEKQGIKIEYFLGKDTKSKAAGSYAAQGMKITLDVGALSKALSLGGIADPLTPVFEQIPQIGVLLIGLARLGEKFVIHVGDTEAGSTASPVFVPGPIPDVPTDPGGEVPGGTPGGTPDGSGDIPVADAPIGTDTPIDGGTPPTGAGDQPGVNTEVGNTSGGFALPGLGQVPTLLILAALALAGLYGWLFKTLGGFIIGGGTCLFGLETGVPDLRKG